MFTVGTQYILRPYTKRVFAGVWLLLCGKFLLDFFDLYLDWLALTSTGVVVFLREGLTEFKTEIYDRDKIASISYTQNSIRDKLFSKGDLMIRLEHEIEFPFEQVSYPKKQMNRLLKYKAKYGDLHQTRADEDKSQEEQKFSFLVEALWEVVKEYLDKKSPSQEDDIVDDEE